jgi:hypothetical protein
VLSSTGGEEFPETTTPAEGKETQLSATIACTVMVSANVKDSPVKVQLPVPSAVPVANSVPLALKKTSALFAEVPDMEVVLSSIGLVVIAGVSVAGSEPTHIHTGADSHCPGSVWVTR